MKIQLQKTISFLFLLHFLLNDAISQRLDSLSIELNKVNYLQGDTLNFEAKLNNYTSNCKTATLHIRIEELKTGKKWSFRYPLIKGYFNTNIILDSTLKDGTYALHFAVQKWFFNLNGNVINPSKNDVSLNYVLLHKNKEMVNGSINLKTDSTFRSEYFLFQDSANLFFSRAKRNESLLKINIKNYLDSAFVAVDSLTKFIYIGKSNEEIKNFSELEKKYQFKNEDPLFKTTMSEVIINAKSKKLIDEFQKDNVSGMFSGADGIIIDGLESDDISRSTDLFTFLVSRIGGLTQTMDDEGKRILRWRKRRTDIYVNEIRTEQDLLLEIFPSDIAMIKVFDPGVPVSFGSAQGGTIAIYLKNGIYQKKDKPTNTFYLSGYTGLDVILK